MAKNMPSRVSFLRKTHVHNPFPRPMETTVRMRWVATQLRASLTRVHILSRAQIGKVDQQGRACGNSNAMCVCHPPRRISRWPRRDRKGRVC